MALVRYDHIVVGAGALGAATAYWLARATSATSVLVCEQFTPGHPWGSSDDHSRIIRHAYHSPVYTALTPSAYALWDELEDRAGKRLIVRTGGLDLAPEGSPVLRLYQQSLDAAGIPYDELDVTTLRQNWPQWEVPDDTVGMYQAEAGLVDIRKATETHLNLANATIQADCTVHGVESTDNGVRVRTTQGDFEAGSLVICAGSWLGAFLDQLGRPFSIELTQEQVQYFQVKDPDAYRPDRFPVWIWHGDHEYYGIPAYGERAVKAARDMTGRFVTPETRGFDPDPVETEHVRTFLSKHLPDWAGQLVTAKTCVYDLPRDRELIVGALPEHPRVFVAVGAGHAGKFATLIGKILADLVTDGKTSYPIDAFRPDRPELADDAPAKYRLGVTK